MFAVHHHTAQDMTDLLHGQHLHWTPSEDPCFASAAADLADSQQQCQTLELDQLIIASGLLRPADW